MCCEVPCLCFGGLKPFDAVVPPPPPPPPSPCPPPSLLLRYPLFLLLRRCIRCFFSFLVAFAVSILFLDVSAVSCVLRCIRCFYAVVDAFAVSIRFVDVSAVSFCA